MNQNIIDCEPAERDAGMCGCKEGSSLEILKDVHKMYEEKMARIDMTGGGSKLELQVEVLRSWVSDLVAQNKLLATAVQELEAEATAKLIFERKRYSEVVSELRVELLSLRRHLRRKDSDLRGLIEVLRRLRENDSCACDGINFFEVSESDIFGSKEWRQQRLAQGEEKLKFKPRSPSSAMMNDLSVLNESLTKDNMAKDREIRKLTKDVQQHEQTIMNLKEMSCTKCNSLEVRGTTWSGNECGDWEPGKDYTEIIRHETLQFQERIQDMETKLKSSSKAVLSLRKMNASLSDEIAATRQLCTVLIKEGCAVNTKSQFKDDIIRSMRRKIRQLKAKGQAKEPGRVGTSLIPRARKEEVVSGSSSTPKTRNNEVVSDFLSSPRAKKEGVFSLSSTPTAKKEEAVSGLSSILKAKKAEVVSGSSSSPGTRKVEVVCDCHEPDTSLDMCIIERPPSPPILLSDTSTENVQGTRKLLPFNRLLPNGPNSPRSKPSMLPRPSTLPPPASNKARCHGQDEKTTQSPNRSDNGQVCGGDSFVKIEEQQTEGINAGGRCSVDDCKQDPEIPCKSPFMPRVKTEDGDRSDSGMKDSGGACSLDSATGSCDANARANHYQNELLSTKQILQNKEETIRVQMKSLAEAEKRIAALTEKANELKRELDRKSKELNGLRDTVKHFKVDKVDACINSETEMNSQNDLVNTLQNNLSVIEDLYRECFYETAKQENLIDMLRKSYLDVRLMDKQKADQIGRLQTVIDTQKWSLERCQDIAQEVDSLKMEISNFLSSSTPTNNDSGMWERSEESLVAVPGVQEELHDVMGQLLRLREILTCGGVCELEEENERLKRENETMQKTNAELSESRSKMQQRKDSLAKLIQDKLRGNDLEKTLSSTESNHSLAEPTTSCQYQNRIISKMKEEIRMLREKAREQNITSESLTTQLRQTKVLLEDKTNELRRTQQVCDSRQRIIDELKEESNNADYVCKENLKIRKEVSFLSEQVSQWRMQLEESQRRVVMLEVELGQVQTCYREKERRVSQLKHELDQAHANGEALCGNSRQAICSVKQWTMRMRDRNRELQMALEEKTALISSLQQRLKEQEATSTQGSSTSSHEPICRKFSTSTRTLSSSRLPRCCSKPELNPQYFSAGASCSTVPTPPKRTYRKSPICRDRRCPSAPWVRDVSAQSSRHDASVDSRGYHCERLEVNPDRDSARSMSPTHQILTRIEQLSDAFADAKRRWTRPDQR